MKKNKLVIVIDFCLAIFTAIVVSGDTTLIDFVFTLGASFCFWFLMLSPALTLKGESLVMTQEDIDIMNKLKAEDNRFNNMYDDRFAKTLRGVAKKKGH